MSQHKYVLGIHHGVYRGTQFPQLRGRCGLVVAWNTVLTVRTFLPYSAAQTEPKPGDVKVQFCDSDTQMAYGWYVFPENDFEIDQ